MAKKEKPDATEQIVSHVVVRRFIAYGVKLDQGVGVNATHWPKLLPLKNAKFLRDATPADTDRRFVDVPATV